MLWKLVCCIVLKVICSEQMIVYCTVLWFFFEMPIGNSDIQSLCGREMVNFVIFSKLGMLEWKCKTKTTMAFNRVGLLLFVINEVYVGHF